MQNTRGLAASPIDTATPLCLAAFSPRFPAHSPRKTNPVHIRFMSNTWYYLILGSISLTSHLKSYSMEIAPHEPSDSEFLISIWLPFSFPRQLALPFSSGETQVCREIYIYIYIYLFNYIYICIYIYVNHIHHKSTRSSNYVYPICRRTKSRSGKPSYLKLCWLALSWNGVCAFGSWWLVHWATKCLVEN